jgi:hypothetical protein
MNAKYQILDKVFEECINCVTNEGKRIGNSSFWGFGVLGIKQRSLFSS